MKKWLLGIAFLFPLLGATSASAFSEIKFGANNYDNALADQTTQCLLSSDVSQCPITGNALQPGSAHWISSVSFPSNNSSTTFIGSRGFGFRASENLTIYGIGMPLASYSATSSLDVEIVLGDDMNALPDIVTNIKPKQVYSTNEKVIFDLISNKNNEAVSPTFSVPLQVHEGQMVWIRLLDTSGSNLPFYGLSFAPWTSDPYNGYTGICTACYPNPLEPFYSASATPYMTELKGIWNSVSNPSALSTYPISPIPTSFTWRDSGFMHPISSSMQMTLYTSSFGNGTPSTGNLSSWNGAPPVEPTYLECDMTDIACGLQNLGTKITYSVKTAIWYFFDVLGSIIKWLFVPDGSVTFSDLEFEKVIPFSYFSYLFDIQPSDLDPAYQLKLPSLDTGVWQPLNLSWYGITENEASANLLRNFVTTFIILSVIGGMVALTKLT